MAEESPLTVASLQRSTVMLTMGHVKCLHYASIIELFQAGVFMWCLLTQSHAFFFIPDEATNNVPSAHHQVQECKETVNMLYSIY